MQRQASQRTSGHDRRDNTYGSLEAFPEFLEKFTPPADSFDPRGAWKLSYAVWLFAAEPGAVGFLEIERQPSGGMTTLKVATRIGHYNGYQQQNATVECATDALSTLRSLELESTSGSPEGEPLPATKTSARVQVRGSVVEFTHGTRSRAARVTAPVVASWGLLDATR